ncbi:30S ribosomal protein S3-like [Triticum urartu]|nr:30S ribosomal protein S3-like [Triticum urartu]
MGLCASMLQRRTEGRYPEPRRGTARALFVVRGDRRPSNPEALVVRVQDSGRTQLRRHGTGRAESGGRGGCWQQGTDALDRMITRARMPRLPCAGSGTVGVEPDAALRTRQTASAERGAPPGLGVEPDAPLYTRKTTAAADRGGLPGPRWTPPTAPATATPAMTPMGGAPAAPSTPASAAMTPGRPVWQRRILMGMRCELPRFSGLVLYDEHGRPIQVGTPGRRNHRQGKKKTARTSSTTTLRDLL